MQLVSGEWLKGEIRAMYNETLEFDSEKLDLLSIDWRDVRYLKSHRATHVHLETYGTAVGRLLVTGERLTVGEGESARQFERSQLVSFTPAGENEVDLWALKFTLGLNLRSGNTEQIDFSSKFSARRRTAETRFLIDYIGNISRTGAGSGALEETVNNHRLSSSLDVYATRRFFYTPLFVEYFRDPFQNMDRRLTLGAGLGYSLQDTARLEWTVNGGVALLNTRYVSVLPGEDIEVSSGALVGGTDVDYEINPRMDFLFRYSIQASRRASGGYTHHMIATLESELTGELDLDVSLLWDRISQPALDEQGRRPKRDDYRLMLGISYAF